jgi:hypothetical protein
MMGLLPVKGVLCKLTLTPSPARAAAGGPLDDFQVRRLLLRFERISDVHYALKTLAYSMINLRHYCRN